MKTGKVVAIVIIIAIVALALGTTIGYSIASGKTSTTTKSGETSTTTQTLTMTSTLDLTFTRISTYTGAANVEITGQVSTVNYSPRAVQFENSTCMATPQPASGCIFSANLTYLGGTVSSNQTYYWSTIFSATVPNNQNYSVTVIFAPNEKNTTSFAGFLPLFNNLNGTGYVFIRCILSGANSSSSPEVCLIDKNLSAY